ncbi:MAG: HAD-IIIA family hydrolase [Bacteroidales bacterium]|nr:HAD-IIIA family hydrolase [Bacteroidales bacterium]
MFKDCKYLFLDRDGVINERIIGGYILRYEDFRFKEGVLEALKYFSHRFERIFIVTNQQCIGKKLISEEDFLSLNAQMLRDISLNGGRIDRVYYCPFLKSENSPLRKPATGMGLKAKEDFPEIDFALSLMAGDSESDMRFGKGLGMKTAFIDNRTGEPLDGSLADMKLSSLMDLADVLKKESGL